MQLARGEVVAQYMKRAQEAYDFAVTVWDLGQYAGRTSGACFWLSLAAGLAEISGDVLAQALPGDHPACAFLAEVRVCGIASAMKGVARTSPLGLCAEALRSYFCAGPDAVLLTPNIRAHRYPAFVALGNNGPARTEAMHIQWVESWRHENTPTNLYCWRSLWSCQSALLSFRIHHSHPTHL